MPQHCGEENTEKSISTKEGHVKWLQRNFVPSCRLSYLTLDVKVHST